MARKTGERAVRSHPPKCETPELLSETADARAFLRVHTLLTRDIAGGPQGGTVEARERLLTPGEVASLFRVDPKTVTRWAAAGRISSIRTPGGHRRFRESEVRALLRGEAAGAGGGAAAPRQPTQDEHPAQPP